MTGAPESGPGRRRLEADLERRILHGLALEWDASLDLLTPAERARMRPPLFELADMESRYGQWSAAGRRIVLSRRLVLEHSWDSAREVLRHEMAHQFADEVLGAVGEKAHGPAFRRACERLRADPRASGSLPPLDERLRRGEADEEAGGWSSPGGSRARGKAGNACRSRRRGFGGCREPRGRIGVVAFAANSGGMRFGCSGWSGKTRRAGTAGRLRWFSA
jgi:hypothetical protein